MRPDRIGSLGLPSQAAYIRPERVAATAIGTVLALLTSCSDPDHANSAGTSGPASAAQVPPGQTCRDFALTYVSADTRRDNGPGDARYRAAERYGTRKLARQLATSARSRPSGQFERWSRHGGHVEITSTNPVRDDPPPTRAGRAAAGFTLSGHVAGEGGWREPYGPMVVYCSLTTTPAGWRVDDVRVSQGVR